MMENLDSWKPGVSDYKIWIEVLIGEKLFGDQVSKEKSGSGLYLVGFSIRIYFLIIVATASTKSYQPRRSHISPICIILGPHWFVKRSLMMV